MAPWLLGQAPQDPSQAPPEPHLGLSGRPVPRDVKMNAQTYLKQNLVLLHAGPELPKKDEQTKLKKTS